MLFCALTFVVMSYAQTATEQPYFAPLNSLAAFVEYSNSSSHIVLGDDRQRKFAGISLAYQRRISVGRWMAWDYSAEVRPILIESDPTFRGALITGTLGDRSYISNDRFPVQVPIMNTREFHDRSISGTLQDGTPFTEQVHNELGRRWTYAPGLTPACFSVHILPPRRLQTFLAATGGFLVSPRDIPEFKTSAFNFTFSFGGGVEWFQDHRRSWTMEYRVQHMSNKEIGFNNPGVDSQFLRVGYRFGF